MDIDTTPPAAHHENRPSMQLDIPPPDEVMMEVDADISFVPPPVAPQEVPNAALSSISLPHPTNLAPWPHPSSPSRPLDCASAGLRFVPNPPAAVVTSSDVGSWPKLKLDQLFIEWFARPESQTWLSKLLQDTHLGDTRDVSNGEQVIRFSRLERSASPGRSRSPTASRSSPAASPQQAPGSPVSRLFRTHAPLGESDSSPCSPPMAPTGSVPILKTSSAAQPPSSMDLGRSGTISPLKGDSLNAAPGPPASLQSRLESNFISSELTPTRLLSAEGDEAFDSRKEISSTKTPNNFSALSAAPSAADAVSDVTPAASLPSHENEATGDVKREPTSSAKSTDLSFSEASSNRKDVVYMHQVSVLGEEARKDRDLVSSDANGLCTADSIGSAGNNDAQSNTMMEMSRADGKGSTAIPSAGGLDTVVKSDGGGKMEVKVSSQIPPASPIHTSTGDASSARSVPRSKRKSLPRFYFPCGRDAEERENKEREALKEFFKARLVEKKQVGASQTDIAEVVVEVMGLPSYFASIVYNAIMEQFPRPAGNGGGGNAVATVNQAPSGGEENMKDVGGRGERSSGPSVSGVEQSAAADEAWRANADTTMGDAQGGANDVQRANGVNAMENVVGTSDGPGYGDVSDNMAVNANDYVTEEQMMAFYKSRCSGHSRESRLFYALLGSSGNRDFLIPSDFKPLMRALLMCHQGLAFLHATPEFQQRYSETVIERIYFGCTRQHNGRLTLADIKRSKLLDTLMVVDEEEDINRERRFFSYEHFYVLYCRFWELDANHDLQIDKEDLMRYGSHCLTNRIVDRIFSGHARPLDAPENGGYMSYTDFIWFCLSEEDKTSDTAIDYWFRCVDMDGDGLITMYDMEYFYKEQLHRMESFGHEPVHIKDILCQLLDMINPNMRPPVIRRRDLKRCRLAGNFFNVLFNLNKFFAIEARDPLQIRQEHATPQLTDWDRFAALEYLRLSADEEADEDESWEEVGEAANPLMAGEAPF